MTERVLSIAVKAKPCGRCAALTERAPARRDPPLAAKEKPMTHARTCGKMRVWKKFCKTGETVFVHAAQTVDASRKNAFAYGEGMSVRPFDKETNLFYNYFRYYDPQLGRYPTFDPLGLAAGINGYVYVDNQPTRYIDPYGLNPATAVGAGIGTAILPGPGTVVGAVVGTAIGIGIGVAIDTVIQQSKRPSGAIDAIPGSKEWGRKNGVGNAVDIFHEIKKGNRRRPGSKAADNCSVNPNTGEVFDGNGEHIGDLSDGH